MKIPRYHRAIWLARQVIMELLMGLKVKKIQQSFNIKDLFLKKKDNPLNQ